MKRRKKREKKSIIPPCPIPSEITFVSSKLGSYEPSSYDVSYTIKRVVISCGQRVTS